MAICAVYIQMYTITHAHKLRDTTHIPAGCLKIEVPIQFCAPEDARPVVLNIEVLAGQHKLSRDLIYTIF